MPPPWWSGCTITRSTVRQCARSGDDSATTNAKPITSSVAPSPSRSTPRTSVPAVTRASAASSTGATSHGPTGGTKPTDPPAFDTSTQMRSSRSRSAAASPGATSAYALTG
ncbi:hypothetical protein GCM10025868_05580 [Angustibacter aerolatus]|uniref:Uncharacterized protein n=1 Tax=Angustibacter aerolatus TaxID=1162965 RepID=A0ABQ6JCW7_9ACTN|nr:hypothetical protein GCM10025868_05580 [Angustibacter aerolatus]